MSRAVSPAWLVDCLAKVPPEFVVARILERVVMTAVRSGAGERAGGSVEGIADAFEAHLHPRAEV